MSFPVDRLADRLRSAFATGGPVVLKSPTGSGKSTRVPAILHQADPGAVIWVVQPRRLAARSVATWVAHGLGEEPGGRVGWQVRFDSRVSGRTRVHFLTPGVALRRLCDPGVALPRTILLDEFHERQAEVDALAALCLEKARTGVGPSLWILSATVDPGALRPWLAAAAGPVTILESEGRQFPVRIEHAPPPSGTPLPVAVAARALEVLRGGNSGDVLAFLPGMGEIRAAARELERRLPPGAPVSVFPLHGDLEPEEQDLALVPAPPGRVHVVLATNIAETSLTLPGVRTVVDAGYVRSLRHDPERGVDRLATVRASQRSADQRAGRAGRVAEGRCWRLWSESDRPPQDEPPEVERIDLAGLVLQLGALGVSDLASLPWPTPPPPERLVAARGTLERLGALGPDGRSTPLGRRLARLPTGPREGRVLLEAAKGGCLAAAAAWIARREARGSDDERRLRDRLERSVRDSGEVGREGGFPLGRALLAGYPDRVASRAGGNRWRLPDGRVAEAESDISGELLLALEVQEVVSLQGPPRLRLREAEPLDEAWLSELFGEALERRVEVEWDERARRVRACERLRLSGRELTSRSLDDNRIPRAKAEELLAARLATGDIRWRWGEEEELWTRRTRLVADAFPERGLSRLDGEDLELVRAALCEGCLAAPGVESREVLPLLKEIQGSDQAGFVERMAPLSVGLSSGRKAKLLYQSDRTVLLAARIGDLIGVRQASVRIGQGRIPMLFEILAPNHRPVQRTSDLDGFWERSYPEIRKDLQRRYPRHPWP